MRRNTRVLVCTAALAVGGLPALTGVGNAVAPADSVPLVVHEGQMHADGSTTQSVFAGSFTVQARVTKGTPIITVKPNSAAPEQHAGAGTVEEFTATISESEEARSSASGEPPAMIGRAAAGRAARSVLASGARIQTAATTRR